MREMKISIIVAMGKFGVIGYKNKLPWHLPADLSYFKKITLGKPIIMGRKTYESIGKPLPGRENIVITSNYDYNLPNIKIVHTIPAALAAANNAEEVMIIGGAEIFKALLPQTQRLYLTYIDNEFAGDTFFPEIKLEEWQEISREEHPSDEKNPYAYQFIVLKRK